MKNLLVVLFCLFSSIVIAQPRKLSTTNKKAIKLYEEGNSQLTLMLYDKAEESFLKAIEKDNNFTEAHIMLGYTYMDSKQYKKASKSFRNALEIDPVNFNNALYIVGVLEFMQGHYGLSKTYFNKYLMSGRVTPKLEPEVRFKLECCDFAMKAKKNPYPFDPINLGKSINSENDEYFPCITVDDQTLLFTRIIEDTNSSYGRQEDFFVSHFVDGKWTKSYNLGFPINTVQNEGAPTLSADGQTLIFTACEGVNGYGSGREGLGSCDLFYSFRVGSRWSKPRNMGQSVNTRSWESQPSYSADGKTLYFVRGLTGREGNLEQDIFSSTLDEEGRWSKSKKLSTKINTPGKESSVLIHPDGNTLYFSSDGHVGMGGLDIFMSKKDKNGKWGNPINLGYPINTHNDESSLLVSSNGKIAYFASDREGGIGKLDLYSFELPSDFKPDEVTFMKGHVYDAASKKPLESTFELIDLETGVQVVFSRSNPGNGEFLVALPYGKEYALNVNKKGYLPYSESFKLEGQVGGDPYEKDVYLNVIEVNKNFVLKNIFFETNEYQLQKKSNIELNKLVGFLEKNKNIKMEVGGHTDNVGSESENRSLSQKRAKAVADYLISKGIASDRLQHKGYGESKPISDNKTEEGRSQNRRTEFTIIEN